MRLLALSPHPDDVEIGMGGTVAALARAGHEVVLCDLTNGEPTPRGSVERRAAEAAAAAQILGVTRRLTLPLPNRYLADTVENRQVVAEIIREARPDLLLIPYWVDAHPDHVAACALGEAARFYAKLTKTQMRGEPFYPARTAHFLCSHYRLHERPAFVVDITETIEQKIASIAAYASQFGMPAVEGEAFLPPEAVSVGEPVPPRSILGEVRAPGRRGGWSIEDLIRHANAYWGYLIGRPYGEPFYMREPVALASLDALLRT